jgi:hypothetical protein
VQKELESGCLWRTRECHILFAHTTYGGHQHIMWSRTYMYIHAYHTIPYLHRSWEEVEAWVHSLPRHNANTNHMYPTTPAPWSEKTAGGQDWGRIWGSIHVGRPYGTSSYLHGEAKQK